MKKRVFRLVMVLSLSLGGVFATDFLPSNVPLASQQPPKPNILLVLDSSGSMRATDMFLPENYEKDGDPAKSNVSRNEALKIIVKKLLNNYRNNVYMGFAKLPYTSPADEGWYDSWDRDISLLLQPVVDLTDTSALDVAIAKTNSITAHGQTPLAFAVYEVAKHLRGEPMLQMVVTKEDGSGDMIFTDPFPSPVRYRCQKQHMILLTDGGASLYMDGIFNTLASDNPPLSDGLTDLEKIAKQLWAIDLRDAKNKTLGGSSDSLDAGGKAWNSEGSIKLPLYMHAIRFGTDKDAIASDLTLQKMVNVSGDDPITEKKNGLFRQAHDAVKLDEAFYEIFQSIIATRSGAESFHDQNQISTKTVKYSNYYNPSSWTGEITAKQFNPGTEEFDIKLWTTNDTIKYNQGEFVTIDSKGITTALTVDALELTQENADTMVEWLKGASGGNSLRVRDALLGDIVESHPVYSAKDVLNINLDPLNTSVRAGFIKYLHKKNDSYLKNLIIAGSNDGLINFINSDKNASNKGERFVSYFPSFLKDQIEKITTSNYTHLFQINGETNIFDAKVGSDYKTIGVTSLAAGRTALVGYTLYSIGDRFLNSGDASFKINFEITTDNTDFKNLGYTYSGTEFYNRQKSGGVPQAVAVFGNGFGAEDDVSSVYFIDAVTGKVINEIELGNTGGAATPAIVVKTGAGGFQQIDRLYVGDFSGNLHRIIFNSDDDITQIKKTILFKAGGEEHPISVRPALVMDGYKKLWVYFGTGLAADVDRDKGPKSKVTHNFYGIRDDDKGETVKFGDLDEQKITSSKQEGETALMTTSNMTAYAEFGWYISLKSSGETDPRGERVVRHPVAYNNSRYIHFVSWGVSEGDKGDLCDPDGIFGKSFTLKAFNGNSSNLGGISGISGTAMEADSKYPLGNAPGTLTDPDIAKNNKLGGSGDSSSQLTDKEKEGLVDGGGSYVKEADVIVPEMISGNSQYGGDDKPFAEGRPQDVVKIINERIYFDRKF